VQNTNNMALTERERTALRKLDAKTKLEIMHTCANSLALVPVEEYCLIMGGKRRTVYKAAKDDKLMKFELSGHIFLAINDK